MRRVGNQWEVLKQGACCVGVNTGCVLWIEGANTKECTGCVCVCVCVGGGEEGGLRAIRSVYEKYLKRERYFVSASHRGLSSRPLS